LSGIIRFKKWPLHWGKKWKSLCDNPESCSSLWNVGKDMCSSHYREDAAVCSSHDREDTTCRSRERGWGWPGLLWSVATYVRTFHRLHLLRLWTPTILDVDQSDAAFYASVLVFFLKAPIIAAFFKVIYNFGKNTKVGVFLV
jgi:hypothetical protein